MTVPTTLAAGFEGDMQAIATIAMFVLAGLSLITWFGVSSLRSIARSMQKIAEQLEAHGKEASKD